MPFKKGEAANPGGRGKESQYVKAKLCNLTKENLDLANKIKRDTDDDKLRWEITRWQLEMVAGKPNQPMTGADGGPIQLQGVRIYLPPESEDGDDGAE